MGESWPNLPPFRAGLDREPSLLWCITLLVTLLIFLNFVPNEGMGITRLMQVSSLHVEPASHFCSYLPSLDTFLA